MPYIVQFVGLVCFYRERGSRQALLPDGRNPGQGIDPHFASIIVAPDAVEEALGWGGDADMSRGAFSLPPCTIALEGADKPGTLDTSRHDDRLPQLRQIDSNFEIDPDRADTIARLHIRQGTLTAYTIPGGAAVISELEVPHDGSITVTVTPRDGSAQRTLRLRPETEIAVTNMGRGSVYEAVSPEQENGHFRIYERLSIRTVSLAVTPAPQSNIPGSKSHHALFARARPINLNTSCSNTGCCSG